MEDIKREQRAGKKFERSWECTGTNFEVLTTVTMKTRLLGHDARQIGRQLLTSRGVCCLQLHGCTKRVQYPEDGGSKMSLPVHQSEYHHIPNECNLQD